MGVIDDFKKVIIFFISDAVIQIIQIIHLRITWIIWITASKIDFMKQVSKLSITPF
jgi:hypothetical protein